MNGDVARAALAEALRIHHPIMRSETGPFSGCRCGQVRLGQDVIAHVVTELLPVVRHLAAEELRAAADAYESDAEQPHLNYLADHVYRPGDCLSSLWLRDRAAALDTPDHGKA